jgi:hypothetical protein
MSAQPRAAQTTRHPQREISPRHEHLAAEAAIALGDARRLAGETRGFNSKTAIVVPAILGSMPFFWFCLVLTLCSLPAVLSAFDHEVLKDAAGLRSFFPSVILKVSLIALVAWIAQTFIQLVALPVLQVSNNAQMAQQEAHATTILHGVERAEDLLDLETAGGLRALQEHLDRRFDALGGAPQELGGGPARGSAAAPGGSGGPAGGQPAGG